MPELPEVETVKRGLKKYIVGKTVESVDFDWPKSFPNDPKSVESFLIKAKITDVKRRAKVLIINLDSDYSLVTHLKMTGQLIYVGEQRYGAGHPNHDFMNELPVKATRVTIAFKDKTKLFFNDQRKFGWMRLIPTMEIQEIDFFKRVGPEPLSKNLTSKDFIQRVKRKKNSTIKGAILDQTTIAGIGNIYADEALFLAGIHPARRVHQLSNKQLEELLIQIRYVLELGIKSRGSTDRNYVNADGKMGSYLEFANVFRREGQPCKKCGTIIEKSKVAGRGTHYCPVDQKPPRGWK